MKNIRRLLTNICSDKLPESKFFYTRLFDFEVNYDSDWFVHLISKDNQLELGIIRRGHEVVPPAANQLPQGFYITFVVDDADALFGVAQKEGFRVLEAPANTFYGQRRLLLEDPNGTLVDVSAPIPDFQF